MEIRSTTWKYIRRSPHQSLAAVLTMFLTFLMGGFFFLASVSSNFVLSFFESKPQITVFFTDKAGKKEADALTSKLKATGKTASVKFISKEEALAIYRDQNKNDPLLLEMVTADILPSSLEISATDPKYLAELEPVIRQGEGVEDIVFQKDVVDSMIAWSNAIRLIGLFLAGLLSLDSILIIMTVIGMKIAIRREEIEILTLVGASPWYIRWPFVLEGAFYGFMGSIIAWGVLSALVLWFRPFLLSFLGIVPEISNILSHAGTVFFIYSGSFFILLSGSGILLGSIGSLISIGRYLKSK